MRLRSPSIATRQLGSALQPLLSSAPARPCPASRSPCNRRRLLHDMAASADGQPPYKPKYVDIGINLADPIFRGRYGGKQRHPDDLHAVVQRAKDVGCVKLIVTGSSFRSSREALKLADEFPGTVYSTAGVHPCSSAIFGAQHPHHHEAEDDEHTAACDPDPSKPVPEDKDGPEPDLARSAQIIADLRSLVLGVTASGSNGASSGRLVAFGEFGLDYDRLHYCPKSLQRHSFKAQLDLVAALASDKESPLAMPLFLHSRAAHRDFVAALTTAFGPKLERLPRGGVVHSFTGTAEEARELTVDLGLYVGVNGCSFKTAENCEVVKSLPLDRLMIETDGPWCEVRPSHEGWKYLVQHYANIRAQEEEKQAAAAAAAAEDAARTASAAPTVDDGAHATPAQQVPSATALSSNNGTGRQQKKKPQQQQGKNQKKPSEVPERFKSVKKEKWEEAAMVKSRNEPCTIERIAIIVACIKGISVQEVTETAWANTIKVFGLDEKTS